MSIEYIQENKNYYEERINELNDKVKYYQNKTQRQHKEIKRLNNIITELEESIQKEIDRTNKLILEDASMIEINNIRKMLNDTRQCILFKLKELKGNNND